MDAARSDGSFALRAMGTSGSAGTFGVWFYDRLGQRAPQTFHCLLARLAS